MNNWCSSWSDLPERWKWNTSINVEYTRKFLESTRWPAEGKSWASGGCTEADWEIEADPRHAERVAEQLGIEDRGVSTPDASGVDEEDDEGDVPLEGEDVTRGVIARCNYLAADRPDCVFAFQEGCREMSKPTTGSLRRLRHISRDLKMHPRLVWKYAMQGEVDEITVRTDADLAGCRRSRKSTSGGSIPRGTHCIKT